MIKIFKGDDTGGTFGASVLITITTTETSLSGCYADFTFAGITKEIAAPLTSGEQREIFYSHNETAAIPLGTYRGTFRIIDSAGKIRTFDNTVTVLVTDRVKSVYPGDNEVEFDASVVPQLLKDETFDMLSTDWSFRQLVAKLGKFFGLTVTNETLPEE